MASHFMKQLSCPTIAFNLSFKYQASFTKREISCGHFKRVAMKKSPINRENYAIATKISKSD